MFPVATSHTLFKHMSNSTSLSLRKDLSSTLRDGNILHCPDRCEPTIHFCTESLEAIHGADDDHFWMNVRKDLVTRLIRRYVRRKNFCLLDVGCGSGGVLSHLENIFPLARFTGLDACSDALLHARSRTKANLVLDDLANPHLLKNLNAPFHVISILDVLEHLDNPVFVLRALQSLLTEDGIIIASVPASQMLWCARDEFIGHRLRYSRAGLCEVMDNAGFIVIHASYWFLSMFLPVLISRKIIAPIICMKAKDIERVELKHPPPILNFLLRIFGNFEALISMYIPLPFGTSVYCVVTKRSEQVK